MQWVTDVERRRTWQQEQEEPEPEPEQAQAEKEKKEGRKEDAGLGESAPAVRAPAVVCSRRVSK